MQRSRALAKGKGKTLLKRPKDKGKCSTHRRIGEAGIARAMPEAQLALEGNQQLRQEFFRGSEEIVSSTI